MKQILTYFLFFVIISSFAQKKITVEAIYKGEFSLDYLQEIHHLENGEEFSYFKFDRANEDTKIVGKSYSDLTERVVLSASDIPDLPYFEIYEFSPDESRVLLGLEVKKRYRYTSSAIYYIYDFKTKQLLPVNAKAIFNPTFSPDGNKLGYVLENNLYVLDINTKKTVAVTTDGKANSIINGLADWVYEEEFEVIEAFCWNPSSTHIAYLKFDESKVKKYSMSLYGSDNYPIYETFKYPKAGEANSTVTVQLYSLEDNNSREVLLKKDPEAYIPRIQWTTDFSLLTVQTLNRKQNKLQIYSIDAKGAVNDIVYTETDKAYVEITDDLTFLPDHSFIKTNENSGFRHLYHYSSKGELINQITAGSWEVTHFYGIRDNVLYYQSTEDGNTERHIYSITLTGNKKKKLTKVNGTHSADFNKDYSLFIDEFSSKETPLSYTVKKSTTGKTIKTLLSNNSIKKKLENYSLSNKKLGITTVNSEELNYWILKPKDFDPSKKYPLLLYQYGGPGSQTVANKWNTYNDYWHQLLASKGYIIACVDGKGTGFKGRDFKKQTQGQLGKLEAADQISFAKKLAKEPYIDASRIGIWGWSYGGFNALNVILKGSTTFKTAIAVAPVTHWKFYDSIYTERFLGKPQDNEEGYNQNSPIEFAANLKGNVLLVHGTADDNVHLQNTLAMVNAFTMANKQFDLALYTDRDHGIYGGVTREQLFRKLTNYILEKL